MATNFSPRAWPRVKWTKAGQLAGLVGSRVQLDPVAEMAPAEAFARLRGEDAVQALHFIALCLPRIDGVRWMAAALTTMAPTNLARRLAARKAVNRWLAEPSDANRRLAFQAGETAGFDSAEGCACLAVFLSGGSLAPATQEQPVPAPPAAFGLAVASAVQIAALNDDPVNMPGRLDALLAEAEKLAATPA
ncbi:MAG: hypothetical protein WCO11_11245 [Sphingomonadales bacterium]|jgi:hypothetical protein